MNIEKYINDLLYFYDLVIIPDFGGFVANYKPARISKTNFTPPSKSVMFNSDLKNNDGLLLNAIVNYEKISQEQAKQKITDFVKATNKKLNSDETVYFQNIGFFKLSKNNLNFEPDIKANFLLESFGFDKFNSQLIESQLQKKLNTTDNTHILSSRRIKQLAVGVPLALLLTLIPYKSNVIKNLSSFNVFQTYSQTEKAVPYDSITVNPKSIDKTVDKITTNKSALFFAEKKKTDNKKLSETKNTEISVKPEKKQIPNTKQAIKPKPETTENFAENTLKKYQLISGSFKEKHNAQKRLKKLQKKGLNPILEKKKNRYRIIACSFSSKAEAKKESRKLKAKKITCWIYTAK